MEYQSGAVSPVGSIQTGWNIIKDDYWTFFGMSLVAIVIMFAVAMIIGVVNNVITFAISAALGASITGEQTASGMTAMLPQIISVFISLFTNVLLIAVTGALFCGLYSALARKVDVGTFDFGDLFSGFQKARACAIVAVVMSAIQFVIGVVTLLGAAAIGFGTIGSEILTKDGKINPAIFGGLFLVILAFAAISIVVNLVIYALTAFVYPLIADRNLSGGEALMTSIKSGLGNFGGLILLLILLFLMMFGGALLCIVGMLFVIPIVYAASFAAYRSVFPRATNDYRYSPPAPPTFGNQPGY
jgi:hypothetical protein